MAKLIGTAGHVDHGKTTLIRALTGIDADRLPEEKRRGMTIDIGFAHIDLPRHGTVSIVDVPGHEKFLRNMLVGALAVDVALLCVAADEGVKPQTREHFEILELLPVQSMVVAMTRADLADETTRQLCREEIEELVERTRFKGSRVQEVSAETGEGLSELKELLDQGLDQGASRQTGLWYMAIDRVFSVKGHGCVVTGTLARGRVQVGDRALIMPEGVEARIRSVQSHGQPSESAEAGQRTALNLSGVKLEQIERGQMIGAFGALFETKMLDAEVRWIERPKHGARVRVSIGSAEAIGKAFFSEPTPEVVQLRLERPIACALGQPLIVRQYSPPELLGGGKVIVPNAVLRRKSESAPIQTGADAQQAILHQIESSPDGLATDEICRRLGETPQSLGDAFERLRLEGKAIGLAGVWLTVPGFHKLKDRLSSALRQQHEASPTVAYHPREKIVALAGIKLAGKPLDRFLASLSESGEIEVAGTNVKLREFKVNLSERQRELLDRVLADLDRGAANPPSPRETADALKVPFQAVEEILRVGQQAGEVVVISPGLWLSKRQLEIIKAKLTQNFRDNAFTVAEMRDTLSTSRKFAVPLAEYLDSVRFTLRVGDKRMIQQAEGK